MTTIIKKPARVRLLFALLMFVATFHAGAQTQTCDGCVGAMGSSANCNIVTLSSPAPTPDVSSVSYNDSQFQLILEDHFNGSSLDLNKWNYGGWIGNDPNYKYTTNASTYTGYSGQNVSVSGGNMHIATTYTPGISYLNQDDNLDPEVRDYLSGSIMSNLLYGMGKYEIRCKLPALNGQWPAFWLYAFSDDGSGYNHNQEIDCFELKQNHDGNVGNCSIGPGCDSYFDPYQASKRIIMTHHYKEEVVPYGQQCSPQMCYATQPLVDAFHTYTVIWDLNKIQWYLDGSLIHTSSRFVYLGNGNYSQNKDFPSPNLPMRIIIGNVVWANYTANLYDEVNNEAECGSPTLPSDFLIDYVKVWKRDCGTTTTLCYDSSPLYVADYAGGTLNTSPTCSEWVVNSGQKQRFTAANEISLKNFHAVAGSFFHASLVGCSGEEPRMAEQENYEVAAETFYGHNNVNPSAPDGIPEPGNTTALLLDIIPNPSNGTFTVSFTSAENRTIQVLIHDITGRRVYSTAVNSVTGKNQVAINPEYLNTGVYLLSVENIPAVQRLLIQK